MRSSTRFAGNPQQNTQSQAQVKTALSPALEIASSNIIGFPSQLRRKPGGAEKLTARMPQPSKMKSGGIRIWRLSQAASASKGSMCGLLDETREILTKHFGVGDATAQSHIDCLLSSHARGMTLCALPGGRGPEPSVATGAAPSTQRPMKISITQAQMAELFAQKRLEKPPENFLRDFIQEFHRRTEPSAAKSRPSESARKAAHS